MESSVETRRLPVRLTRDEYDAKAQELTAKLMQVADLESDLAEMSKSMREKIKEENGNIKRLTTIVRSRQEDRDVECYEYRDSDRMIVQVIRQDTSEIVETRPMSASERQLVMFPDRSMRAVMDEVANVTASPDSQSPSDGAVQGQ
jgi:uncharacterized coiled-coil DUF342 family protein